MRLLEVDTLESVEFFSDQVPAYAILSHTWGVEEVSFLDLADNDKTWQAKTGWAKIRACAHQAKHDGHKYIWVDTCCIDKKSSAELQEAINSMFQWYQKSRVCYAYLSDFMFDGNIRGPVFKTKPRWFSRGWTLQELLAPREVIFLDKDWTFVGAKQTLARELSTITGIAERFLCGASLASASVADRMSWMADRQTTRKEDMAYCMLGLFGIHMPMLYGEGDYAFRRLQEQIIQVNADATTLAWAATRPAPRTDRTSEEALSLPIMASGPDKFRGGERLLPFRRKHSSYLYNSFSMTQRGLQIMLDIVPDPNIPSLVYGVLNCTMTQGMQSPILVPFLLIDEPAAALPSHAPPLLTTSEGRTEIPLEAVALFDSSLPCSIMPEFFDKDRRRGTICLRRDTIDCYDIIDLGLVLPPRVTERYTRYRGYPPCHLGLAESFVYTAIGSPFSRGVAAIKNLLIWLQDSTSEQRHVMIQLKRAVGPDRQLRPWTFKAIAWENPPSIEDFVIHYRDQEIGSTAQSCQLYDKSGLAIAPEDALVRRHGLIKSHGTGSVLLRASTLISR